MNDRIMIAMLTKEGVTIRRKGLLAKFVVKHDTSTVHFLIGVPNKNDLDVVQ